MLVVALREDAPYYVHPSRRSGEIGIRTRLKIWRPSRTCRFESDLRHQKFIPATSLESAQLVLDAFILWHVALSVEELGGLFEVLARAFFITTTQQGQTTL